MSNLVCYFSGTGNSFYIAKRISEAINGELIPFVSLKEGDSLEADLLVFVFPIYDFKPPRLIIEILESLSAVKANHITAVATYGVALTSSLKYVQQALGKHGLALSLGYGLKMPHNAVGSIAASDNDDSKRLEKADQKLSAIISSIRNRASAPVEKTSLFEDGTLLRQMPVLIKFLFKLVFLGTDALAFRVIDECISCGQCSKLCPVNNIELREGRPVFLDYCTSCFACLQWCPESAIHIGKYSFEEIYMKPYCYPMVKATELIRR